MSDADNSLPRDAAYWQRAYDDCLEVFEDERARAVVAESRVRELEAQLSAERARLEDIINFMKETARKHCEPAVRRSYEEVVAYFERTYPDDTPQPARPNGERVKCPKLEHTPDDCSAKCPPGWRYPNCTVPAHPDAPSNEGGGGEFVARYDDGYEEPTWILSFANGRQVNCLGYRNKDSCQYDADKLNHAFETALGREHKIREGLRAWIDKASFRAEKNNTHTDPSFSAAYKSYPIVVEKDALLAELDRLEREEK